MGGEGREGIALFLEEWGGPSRQRSVAVIEETERGFHHLLKFRDTERRWFAMACS